MATTTTRLSLRKPETTDTVNVETDIGDNMDTIDDEIGAKAATSFPVTPYTGKLSMRSDDDNRVYVYTGSAWVELLTRDTIMATQQVSDSTDVTTTSTTYASLSPAVSTTFVAPPSGAIKVVVTAALECAAPSSAFMSYEIRETDVSGSVVTTAADEPGGVGQQEDRWHQGSTTSLVTGLTPGDTYFIRAMCKSTSGSSTATFFYRALLIEEALNA